MVLPRLMPACNERLAGKEATGVKQRPVSGLLEYAGKKATESFAFGNENCSSRNNAFSL